MPSRHGLRRASRLILPAALLCLALALPASADGLLEAIRANEEAFYDRLSIKTTDKLSGTTTNTDIVEYGSRSTLRLNYNLLPMLNLNTGATYEKTFTEPTGDTSAAETTLTRLRPYFWLTLRDPIIGAGIGYDLADEEIKTSGQEESSLTRESYHAKFDWRPIDLPFTTARYSRTSIWDGTRTLLDSTQDQIYLKSGYAYRGLDVYYAGRYIDTRDEVRESEARQTTHEGRLLYTTRFLDGRVSVSTDHRVRMTEVVLDGITFTGLGTTIGLSVPAVAGLSAIDDTPITDPLANNPALIDGDSTTSAGVNIGFIPGDIRLRNVGLDFGAAITVNRLHVSIDGFGPGVLPADITTFYTWQVWTSTDNLNWTLQTTVAPAVFSPLDRRFVISVVPLTARYVKVAVRPLPGGIVGTTNTSLFPTIFITEMQAFNDSATTGTESRTQRRVTQMVRSHSIDANVILLRAPSLLYYRFNGEYQEFETDALTTTRYVLSNGLFLSHRFNQVFSGSANASYELGEENTASRQAVLYYASLSATPLRTLTDTLVFSGSRQWIGTSGGAITSTGTATTAETTLTTNSLVLYNTAQVYRGIDATLNLGGLLTSEDRQGGSSTERREMYVNVGTAISPHPALTMTAYYLGKLTHTTSDTATATGADGSADSTQHTLDVGLSFTPFPTLTLSATANIVSQTGQPTRANQNYSMSWAPFPDGTLQLAMFYAESHLPDSATSRIVQPTVRWYMSPKRRSYLDVGYQINTSDSRSVRTEAQGMNARLNIFY